MNRNKQEGRKIGRLIGNRGAGECLAEVGEKEEEERMRRRGGGGGGGGGGEGEGYDMEGDKQKKKGGKLGG